MKDPIMLLAEQISSEMRNKSDDQLDILARSPNYIIALFANHTLTLRKRFRNLLIDDDLYAEGIKSLEILRM